MESTQNDLVLRIDGGVDCRLEVLVDEPERILRSALEHY